SQRAQVVVDEDRRRENKLPVYGTRTGPTFGRIINEPEHKVNGMLRMMMKEDLEWEVPPEGGRPLAVVVHANAVADHVREIVGASIRSASRTSTASSGAETTIGSRPVSLRQTAAKVSSCRVTGPSGQGSGISIASS